MIMSLILSTRRISLIQSSTSRGGVFTLSINRAPKEAEQIRGSHLLLVSRLWVTGKCNGVCVGSLDYFPCEREARGIEPLVTSFVIDVRFLSLFLYFDVKGSENILAEYEPSH